MGENVEAVSRAILSLLSELEDQQHSKLLALARVSVPHITTDDLKNPDDFRALHHDPRFNYEDGVLSGIRVAAAAVRAALRPRRQSDPS